MSKLIANEPVLTAFVTVVTAFLALLVAFGVHLTDTQQAAVIAFVVAVVALAGVVRNAVTPVSKK